MKFRFDERNQSLERLLFILPRYLQSDLRSLHGCKRQNTQDTFAVNFIPIFFNSDRRDKTIGQVHKLDSSSGMQAKLIPNRDFFFDHWIQAESILRAQEGTGQMDIFLPLLNYFSGHLLEVIASLE